MTIQIVIVHPEITIVKNGDRQFELPTSAFPNRPTPGQIWDLDLNRVLHETDKLDHLNQYLRTE